MFEHRRKLLYVRFTITKKTVVLILFNYISFFAMILYKQIYNILQYNGNLWIEWIFFLIK